jgi:hypothetical protein
MDHRNQVESNASQQLPQNQISAHLAQLNPYGINQRLGTSLKSDTWLKKTFRKLRNFRHLPESPENIKKNLRTSCSATTSPGFVSQTTSHRPEPILRDFRSGSGIQASPQVRTRLALRRWACSPSTGRR